MKFRHQNLVLVVLIGLACLPQQAQAEPPGKRLDCALGYANVDFDSGLSIQDINGDATRIEVSGNDGGAVSCSVRLYKGLYAYVGATESDGTLTLRPITSEASGNDEYDVDVSFQRIGLGYGTSIGEQFGIYGQIGYTNSDYDFDPIFSIFGSPSLTQSLNSSETDDDGLDVEAGLTWMPTSALELSAFYRFAENHYLSFIESDGIALSRNYDDDHLVGARFKYRFSAPVFITADVEFGDVDRLFLGLGLMF